MDVDGRGYTHVAWFDGRDGPMNFNIYYSRSTDGGLTFSPNIRLNDSINEPEPQSVPSICVDDSGIVYAVWENGGVTIPDIFFTLSTDTEDSAFVEPNVEVSETDSQCWNSSIAVGDSGKVYVLWKDLRVGGFFSDVYFAKGWYESAVEEVSDKEEKAFVSDPFPNPFRRSTTISFEVEHHATPTSLKVYDLSGRLIKVLVERVLDAGVHKFRWDGKDSNGMVVPSGVYFYKIQIGEYKETRKVLVIK